MEFSNQDVKFYNENGYLLVQGVFSPSEVEEMRSAIDGILDRASRTKLDRSATWQGDYLPQEELKKLVLKGFHDVHYHDSAFLRALSHSNMRHVLSSIVGPNVQLHHSKMLVKPPERGAAFPLHQDHPYFPHEKHTMLAASVHLDDSDMENGCLCVIPGSHKVGPIPHVGSYYLDHQKYPLSKATPCPAKAGDVLFFNYLTIHGSDINRSNRVRRNVLFQYRDPADPPTKDVHVNWGQGLMVCGQNPIFKEYKPTTPSDIE
ncbi:phytanoyl-CoA dioxygenase family protein [Alicyclobacillus fastidiosus]|uniref:Phytanoyl-CoA dioxygenase family protein n=1 Tax=Alicyclobacillus fastidiosus TaxID=392011 RepID=A0ABV5AG95_9BACL|nr:phytanoyl-CoA dioxygenase family protein [Alicyclobacillus fastidiosus]WEH09763.1 phytanoyl-CoA dioxygenase family protein [Alicyclobacillus fastidiosus]